jgi:serine/threonine protein kinase
MGELRCASCQKPLAGSTPFCPYCGAPLAASFAVGSLVDGRYRILEKTGEGAMSSVYRARHERLERDVAVKMLRSLLASDANAVQRFGREARIVAGLSHPNVVSIFDFGVGEDGMPYLVMEFIEGSSLQQALAQDRALTIERAAHVLAQIASALSEAHAMDLVHRDLKPGNVMLTERGPDPDFVKVVDFGLAQRVGIDARITLSGGIVGTPHYLAPESWAGEVGPAADIYALGVLAYELVTGELPFKAGKITALLSEHMELEPPLPSAISAALQPFDDLVRACLAKDPKARPASAGELIDPLRRILSATPSNRGRTTYVRPEPKPTAPDPTQYDSKRSLDAFWDGPSLVLEVTALHAARRQRSRELVNLLYGAQPPENIASLARDVARLDEEAERIGVEVSELDAQIREREEEDARREASRRQELFDANVRYQAAQKGAGNAGMLENTALGDATDPSAMLAQLARVELEIAALEHARGEYEVAARASMGGLMARLDEIERELRAPSETLWEEIVKAARKRSELRPALLELGKVDGAIASYRALVSTAASR